MARGTPISNSANRIAVSFKNDDWKELDRLSKQTGVCMTALIRNLTLRGLKEVTNA